MNKQQKFLHIVSVFAVAFLTCSFYVLGGGNPATAESVSNEGINTDIPMAQTEDLSENKLQAISKEQNRLRQNKIKQTRQASSFDWLNQEEQTAEISETVEEQTEIESRLQALNTSIGTQQPKTANRTNQEPQQVDYEALKQQEIARQRKLYAQKYGLTKTKESAPVKKDTIKSIVEEKKEEPKSGFYGLKNNGFIEKSDIKAVIHGEYKDLKRGSIIKIRLLEKLTLDNIKIPANTFVYGELSFSGSRAMIKVSNIRYRGGIFKFPASIYDKDGFEGIHVPDSYIDEAKNKAAGDIISDINVTVPGSNIVSGAVSSVANAAKTVFQGAVREPKISISANYYITIKQS